MNFLSDSGQEQLGGQMPIDVIRAYNKMAQQGILGDEGISKIMSRIKLQNLMRRRQLAMGLRSSVGRRLGTRSMGLDTMLSNQVDAPQIGELAGQLGGLEQTNYMSKAQGLEGLNSIMQMLFQSAETQKANKKGALDWLQGAASLAVPFIPKPTQKISIT
jgi:hypothetical protein